MNKEQLAISPFEEFKKGPGPLAQRPSLGRIKQLGGCLEVYTEIIEGVAQAHRTRKEAQENLVVP